MMWESYFRHKAWLWGTMSALVIMRVLPWLSVCIWTHSSSWGGRRRYTG